MPAHRSSSEENQRPSNHISSGVALSLCLNTYVWIRYIEYVLHRVRMMRHYGVKPYLVFDGGPLPAKKGTESERSKCVVSFEMITK